ncbi:hypothetical protein PUV54_07170 [Hyphococcus flavus]|uniref:Uncharacterized protein n=1 Tax=Hyphococcus flavus TaxID=1866326 RepID=A0AAE9ZHZ7_9PROT|nr:hypothetical protein [Hyphococcus flavus]WDI32977.1 hypothetical protein PUV54_07170 [Hyphococcus flavus]
MTQSEELHWKGLSELVDSSLKSRVIALADKPKSRPKLVEMFHHKIFFEPSFVREIGKKGTEKQTLNLLKHLGAPSEALMLNNSNNCAGEWRLLEDAVSGCFGWCGGQIVSCIAGQLLFHESDEPEMRSVIFKPQKTI